jgi:hypothetical protein
MWLFSHAGRNDPRAEKARPNRRMVRISQLKEDALRKPRNAVLFAEAEGEISKRKAFASLWDGIEGESAFSALRKSLIFLRVGNGGFPHFLEYQ